MEIITRPCRRSPGKPSFFDADASLAARRPVAIFTRSNLVCGGDFAKVTGMNGKLTTLTLLPMLAAISVSPAKSPDQRDDVPEPPPDVIFERDLPYREGHERWLLNVIRPKNPAEKPAPAVLLVHGGGWSTGDHYRFTKMGFTFAQKGYVVVAPTYRLVQDAAFPACLHDLKNAIRWTRAHAEKYGIDPKRIGAYGNSAGATQVLTAALTNGMAEFEGDGPYREFSSDLQAVAGSGAVGDMLHPTHSERAKWAYGNLARGKKRQLPENEVQAVLRAASPSSYVRTKDAPPLLLVHGAMDEIVIIDSTDAFVEAMKAAGAPVSYLRFEDAGHAAMGQKAKVTMPAMFEFFAENLKL